MAYIFQADLFCDRCGEAIATRCRVECGEEDCPDCGTVGLDVLTILQKANKALASDYFPDVGAPEVSIKALGRAYRLGIASLAQTLLFESGNHAGFMYLETPYRAGMTDESRRFYHLSPRLAKL